MNFNLFIARKLFREHGDVKKVSRPAILIATSGVAVGLAVMVISVCVVLGFKQEISSKVVGFGSHIQIQNYASVTTNSPQPIAIPSALMKEVGDVEGVAHVQRFCNKEGILKTDADFKGILLHGVGVEFDTSFLKAHMEEGELPSFSDTVASNRIVISRQIADELHLEVGSKVFAYFFENSVRTRRFTVSGIYCTHLTEFDKALVFTDIYTCNRLNAWAPDQYSGMEIAVKDLDRVDEVASVLVKRICMAQSFGCQCVGHFGFDGISSRVYDDFRFAYYYIGTHEFYRDHESIRSDQPWHPPYFLVFCRVRHGERIAFGKYNRYRHSASSALCRNIPFGCVDILRGFGTGFVQFLLCVGYQRGNFGDMRVFAYRSELLGFPYSSGSVYSF